MIKVDGTTYPHVFVHAPIRRTAEIKDTSLTGFMLDGKYHRDIMGVYYQYEMQFSALRGYESEYTALHEVLASATEFHTVTVPYNQTTMTYTAYVTMVADELKKISGTRNIWGNCTVSFLAKEPK